MSARSAFSLLKATGEDCPGAIQLVRPERVRRLLAPRSGGVSESGVVSESREIVWLTTANVETRLRTLRHDNSAWRLEEDVGQFSLAGAQSKTALLLEDGRWGVPRGATPTTHILKPPIPGFPRALRERAPLLQLARALSVPAAPFPRQPFRPGDGHSRRRGTIGFPPRDAWYGCTRKTSARRWRGAPSTNTRARVGRAVGTSPAQFGPTSPVRAKIFALS